MSGRKIRIELSDEYSDFRMTLDDYMAQLAGLRSGLSPEDSSAVMVEFDHGWGDSSGHIVIWYERLQTDAEVAAERRSDERRIEESYRNEVALLKALMEKHGREIKA